METPSASLQIARIAAPPLVVILGSVGAVYVDVLLGMGLFLAGSFAAGWISRSWWCPTLLFVVPMVLLVLAVDHEWTAAKEDGVYAMAIVVGSVAFFVVFAVGALLSSLSTRIVLSRSGGQHRTGGRSVHSGQ